MNPLDQHPAVLAALTGAVVFLLQFAWNRWWRRKDSDDQSQIDTLKKHGDRLVALERKVDLSEAQVETRDRVAEQRHSDQQKAFGKLETEQGILAGKVVGLQEFWRNEFNKLRSELREDTNAMESRLAALLAGHQERVHDRLNIISADQSKMLSDFVDRLVDKHGEE